MLMLNRAFFSLQSNWLPTAVALANLFLNAVLDLAFSSFGTWGIPLAPSLVNVAGTIALLLLLRRRLERLEFRETAFSGLRVVVASAALGAAAFGVWYALDRALGRSFGGQLVSVGISLLVAATVYVAACRALHVKELNALLALRARFRRA